MTTWNATTSMGRGRDTLPLHPIPKTKPGRLHKRVSLLKDMALSLNNEKATLSAFSTLPTTWI